MNLYLSSYKLGNKTKDFIRLIPKNKIGYIPNALDFIGADPERRELGIKSDIQMLQDLGLEVDLLDLPDDFLYSGYSAAGCVLSPSLRFYATVDDSTQTPYLEQKTTIWEGLSYLDFIIMPHWQSDHPESADVDKEIALCEEKGVEYRAIRDGEVLIIEGNI